MIIPKHWNPTFESNSNLIGDNSITGYIEVVAIFVKTVLFVSYKTRCIEIASKFFVSTKIVLPRWMGSGII